MKFKYNVRTHVNNIYRDFQLNRCDFFTFIKENVKVCIVLQFGDPLFLNSSFLMVNESLTYDQEQTFRF